MARTRKPKEPANHDATQNTTRSVVPSPAKKPEVSGNGPGSDSIGGHSEEKGSRVKWTASMERAMLQALLKEVQLGRRAENGFKKEAWKSTLLAVNRSIEKGDLTINQIKNKLTNMKKKYDLFLTVKNSSGFGWDGVRRIPTAPVDVWDRMIEKYPGAKEFRTESLHHFEELYTLYSGTRATGEHAITPSCLPPYGLSLESESKKRSRESSTEDINPDTDQSSTKTESNHPTDTTHLSSEPTTSQAIKVQQEQPNAVSAPSITFKKPTPVRDRISAGKAIAREMANMSSVAAQLGISKTEMAIERVQEEYKELEMEDMVTAMSIFENEIKAKMFVAMKSGVARDAWIKKEIEIYRSKF